VTMEDAWTHWERDVEILRRSKNGERAAALAQEFNLSRHTVYLVLERTQIRQDRVARRKLAIHNVKRSVMSFYWTPQKQYEEFEKELK